MKIKFLLVVILLCVGFVSSEAFAKEISLYDFKGEAVAYIDTSNDFTIHLWNGKPVAYIDNYSVYGFNGKHLGWYKWDVLWDHKGNAVGFVEGALNKIVQPERLKNSKQLAPPKSLQQPEPSPPQDLLNAKIFSPILLDVFLSMGR